MNRNELMSGLQTVHDNLPSKTPKVTRDALKRLIGLCSQSSAYTLSDLAKDFAKPAPRTSAKPRMDVVSDWSAKLRSVRSRSDYDNVAAQLLKSAKSKTKESVKRAELVEIVKIYAGSKGLSGTIDVLMGKLRKSFEEELLQRI